MLERAYEEELLIGKHMMTIPLALLFSHAVKLLLKCALLKRGMTMSTLRSYETRHDLAKLVRLLIEMEVPVTVSTRDFVIDISEQHRRHQLRYTALDEDHLTLTPRPPERYKVLEEFLNAGSLSNHGH